MPHSPIPLGIPLAVSNLATKTEVFLLVRNSASFPHDFVFSGLISTTQLECLENRQ